MLALDVGNLSFTVTSFSFLFLMTACRFRLPKALALLTTQSCEDIRQQE